MTADRPPVRLEIDGDVGVIVVDNPPVNALGPGVGDGIVAALARADADPSLVAMVLIGAGRSFIAGADIRQFGTGIVRPAIGARPTDRIDRAGKPVVAAIHGYALGGGLECALACHYRLASARARVGLPEVLIGAIPGSGGTQRLPRLIGVAAALDLIVSGRHLPAEEALRLGIVDAVVATDEGLRAEAVAFARRMAHVRPLPRLRDRTMPAGAAAEAKALGEAKRRDVMRTRRQQPAPLACIEAVEASTTMPFDAGLVFERDLFLSLESSPEARALRYAFFAEREAAKLPQAARAEAPVKVRTVGIVGAGTMGAGIAMACADGGLDVHLHDASQPALTAALARIRRNYEASVARGRLAAAEVDARCARIRTTDRYDVLADCDAVIEAVYEDLAVKREVFAQLDGVARHDTLLLTNTSTVDIDLIAAATVRPDAVAGAHFFSPANVMKLVEVVEGAATSPRTLRATVDLARTLGKISVVVRNCEGFLANRSRAPFGDEMLVLLEEGARPEDVDRVMVDFGYPMGPFAVSDLAGLDIGAAARGRRAARDPHWRGFPIADRVIALGRLGQKTGGGWYRYGSDGRTPQPDPVVAALIADFVAASGTPPRAIPDDEILHRLLFTAVNECCRIIAEGRVYRASDIDVAWLHGFAFPRHRGGLLFWADEIGAPAILAQIEAWHRAYGPRWTPAPLLREAVATGTRLRELAPGPASAAP